MISKIKKPVSIVLALMMVVSLFAIVPITASAAEETSTVTWDSFTTSGGMSSGGVTLTTTQGNYRVGGTFYPGRGSGTFTAPEGSVFTKIELKNATGVNSLNFPGASTAQTGSWWDEMNEEWRGYYTVTWTGESSEVTFSGAIYDVRSIVFTLKSTAPAHTHDFTYAADGATITATCGEGCDITEGLTLTISAPTGDLTADGTTTFPATLSTGYNTTAFPGTYTIAYTKDGQPYDGTPTEAGAYTASVTVGTATASVSYTVAAPELFWKHSVTLGGDIGVNFYLNPAVINTYTGAKTVKFSWDGNVTTVDVPATATADGYKVTCNVVAAQMAHKIKAEVYVGDDKIGEEYYSVQDYAEKVYNNPAAYDDKGKPDELQALAKAMLNYGAMAQTVFADYLSDKTPALANTTVGNNGYASVTAGDIAAAINGEAFDVATVEDALGAKFYTSSLIYLSRNTLRLYFTPTTYPGEIPNANAYDGSLSDYYYYVDAANIPAAELDNQQTFNVNGTQFTFSALDYAKAVVNSGMGDDQKNLAKSLYLYNQKANAYFDPTV